jgi:putative ABC transport system permease protein
LLNAHSGQNDFTILKQEDNLAISNSVLNLLTSLITAVAAVSLVVGGIGIMNVMIVSVTERTHEIGIRKAVGATNQQILAQFMIESAVISFVGGVIGVISSILLNFMLRISTDLQPVVTLPIMGVAVLVALVVGIVFGVAPALNASRKDPIEALRRV